MSDSEYDLDASHTIEEDVDELPATDDNNVWVTDTHGTTISAAFTDTTTGSLACEITTTTADVYIIKWTSKNTEFESSTIGGAGIDSIYLNVYSKTHGLDDTINDYTKLKQMYNGVDTAKSDFQTSIASKLQLMFGTVVTDETVTTHYIKHTATDADVHTYTHFDDAEGTSASDVDAFKQVSEDMLRMIMTKHHTSAITSSVTVEDNKIKFRIKFTGNSITDETHHIAVSGVSVTVSI